MVDHDDVVGELLGLVHEVRGEQDGRAVAPQGLDELPGGAAGLRVQPGGGLVEEHQLGAPDDGHGQRQALLLAAGERAERHALDVGEPEAVEQVSRVQRGAVVARDQAQQLAGAQPR